MIGTGGVPRSTPKNGVIPMSAAGGRWLPLCGSLAGLGLAFATHHLSAKFGGSHSMLP